MQTGMGATGSGANWDGSNQNTYDWSYSYDLADQIGFYFNVGPNPEVDGPGETFTYIDQDMWIATLAMERFLQQMEGPDATILKMLETEVYDPIGAHNFVAGTGYTETGEDGFPYSAWGALPTIDILARAGTLIANGGVAPDGTQILDAALLEAMTASSDYALAFWDAPLTINGESLLVQQMSGAGGNTTLSFPDGSAMLILSRDDYNYGISNDQLQALVDVTMRAPAPIPVPAALPMFLTVLAGLFGIGRLARRT
jgi:hypothetical protein